MEEEMLKKKVWAVVGASENSSKYGSSIFKKLKSKGYTVYPVSPNYETIYGEVCYKDLSSIPEKPDVLDMVVSPKIGRGIIEEAHKLGIKNLWFQPGTYNDELLKLVEEMGFNAVQACVLTALK